MTPLKILIVEDSSFMQQQIQTFLESMGHQVVGLAANGIEGEERYQELRPDAVTIDITMPNRNGRDCLKAILEFDPEVKCMIISAIHEQEMILECLQIGAKAFIKKPLKFHEPAYCKEFAESLEGMFTSS